LEAGNSAPAGSAAVFGSKQAPAFICRCHQHVETCVTFCCTPWTFCKACRGVF